MKRFNHGLIVGFAVLLLAAVFFVGCEGPAGPAGESLKGDKGDKGDNAIPGVTGKQAEYLEAYGFAFGTPVHTVIGRDAEYSTSITGVATAAILANTALVGGPTSVIVSYGSKSVKVPLSATATPTAIMGALDAAKGYIDGSDLTFAVVADPKGDTTRSSVKVGGIDKNRSFSIEGTGIGTLLFGATIPGATASANSVANLGIKGGLADKWTIPVITKDTADGTAGDTSSAPAKVILNGKEVSIPAASTAQSISNQIATEFASAFQGYTVTGGTTGYVVVTATAQVAPAITQDDLVPTIEGYDLGQYGYKLEWTQTQEGKAPVPDSNPSTAQKYVGVAVSDMTTLAGKVLTLKVGDIWDTTIFPAGTAIPLALTDINYINTASFWSGSVPTVTGGILTLTFGTNGPDKFSVDGSATSDVIGAIDFTANDVEGYVSKLDAGTNDQWTLRVIGGGAVGDLIPTVASKITFGGSTAGNSILIPAGTLGPAILALIQAGTPAVGITIPSYGYTAGTGVWLQSGTPAASTFGAGPALNINPLY